jgi:hypothetical protein
MSNSPRTSTGRQAGDGIDTNGGEVVPFQWRAPFLPLLALLRLVQPYSFHRIVTILDRIPVWYPFHLPFSANRMLC